MSWAAHNPEKYSELCNKGIVSKLVQTLKVDEEDAMIFIEELEHGDKDDRRLHDAFLQWASDEVQRSQANYAARAIDAARERYEE